MASANISESLRAVVGTENAFSADDQRAGIHRHIFSPILDCEATFVAVTLPSDVDQLQRSVRIIRSSGLDVWCTPSGVGNGASIRTGARNGVVVDLSRINRILHVDAASAGTLVEPGVSFRQLYEHLRANHIPLWIDCDANPDNSIAGSIGSRQFGYTPYGDHTRMQCGLEVVLGNGEVVRTGMGAIPKSDCWQVFKYNFGPYLDGLFAQSDLGVISKVGLWLMPAPATCRPFLVTLADEADLAAAIEIARPLSITQVIAAPIRISSRAFESGVSAGGSEDLGAWNLHGSLYGTPENVAISWEIVQKSFANLPGGRLYGPADPVKHSSWQLRQNLMRGIPLQSDIRFSGQAGGRRMWLTTAAAMEGDTALAMHRMARQILTEGDVSYFSEYVLAGRTLLKKIHIPYDPGNRAAFAKIGTRVRKLVVSLLTGGFGIVEESVELRNVVNGANGNSALGTLVSRLRMGIETGSGARR